MSIASSTQPSLRARLLSRFPANVVAGNGLTITKSGGTYTFSLNIQDLELGALEDVPTNTILGREAVGDGAVSAIPVAGGLAFSGANTLEVSANQRVRTLHETIYQNGSVLTTGVKADLWVPCAGVITGVTLLADQSGSVVVDLWKDTYANYPPLVGDTITASAKPTLSSAIKYRDTTLTGWTTNVAQGDIIRVNFDSVSTITRLLLALDIRAA